MKKTLWFAINDDCFEKSRVTETIETLIEEMNIGYGNYSLVYCLDVTTGEVKKIDVIGELK